MIITPLQCGSSVHGLLKVSTSAVTQDGVFHMDVSCNGVQKDRGIRVFDSIVGGARNRIIVYGK